MTQERQRDPSDGNGEAPHTPTSRHRSADHQQGSRATADLAGRLRVLGPAGAAAILARLDGVFLAAMLGALPVEALTAARLGLDVAHRRAGQLLDELLAEDFTGGRWHRSHPLVGYTALQRRRWPPTGDRDLWVRYGPAGPPWWHERAAS